MFKKTYYFDFKPPIPVHTYNVQSALNLTLVYAFLLMNEMNTIIDKCEVHVDIEI